MTAFIASDELRRQLEMLSTPLAKSAGELLFRRGEAVTGVYVIREGVVRLGLGATGKAVLTRTLGPGAVLGLPAALSGKTYSLTAEAMEDSELGFVGRDLFMTMLRETPSLCFQVMDMLSEEISAMRGMVRPARSRATRRPRTLSKAGIKRKT